MTKPTDPMAPPGKEVEYEVWRRDNPENKVVVRARTFYFAVQRGAVLLQCSPGELEARVKL